ncbi:unnamed protein product [Linum tenue]|nr:unnamed protein product [Linum tenue]
MLQCVLSCTARSLARRRDPGLKKKEVVALPTSTYTVGGGDSSSASGCAICLAEFLEGDSIRLLPQCNHRFHVGCIDRWLLAHSSCPTCRHRLNKSMPSLDQIVSSA